MKFSVGLGEKIKWHDGRAESVPYGLHALTITGTFIGWEMDGGDPPPLRSKVKPPTYSLKPPSEVDGS